jgi:MoxR-like ATPase
VIVVDPLGVLTRIGERIEVVFHVLLIDCALAQVAVANAEVELLQIHREGSNGRLSTRQPVLGTHRGNVCGIRPVPRRLSVTLETNSQNVSGMAPDIRAMMDVIQQESAFVHELESEIGKVIVGQRGMVDRILIGLLTGGHILLEGVPGLAKTLAVRTVASAIDAKFSRIQFTPDLLPADLIGTLVFDPKTQEFKPRKGPVFANLVLADEINRAPAKVQSALLEAMQERQVTIGDTTYALPDPFLVLATQNPIEQEGTYPLPEAQTDRFMMHVKVGYPTREDEKAILERMSKQTMPTCSKVVDLARIQRARSVVANIHSDEKVKDYIISIVWATREPKSAKLGDLDSMIEMGASPRASIALNLAARAHAFLKRRPAVFPDDVKAIGPDVLRHRIKLTYEAEAENVKVEDVVRRVFEAVPIP